MNKPPGGTEMRSDKGCGFFRNDLFEHRRLPYVVSGQITNRLLGSVVSKRPTRDEYGTKSRSKWRSPSTTYTYTHRACVRDSTVAQQSLRIFRYVDQASDFGSHWFSVNALKENAWGLIRWGWRIPSNSRF